MQAYDALYSPDVCTIYEPDKGAPVKLPIIDDTTSAATKVAETIQSDLQLPKVDRVSLGLAPTYRSGIVPMSVELAQDSAFDPVDFLARAFGIRMARGISPDLVSTLLGAAQQGAIAAGDPNLSGATGANSIGYADLLALRKSVNPAYRAAGAHFLLNDNTLATIDGWLDKNGRPVLHPQYDANGRRTLLGFPVALCPSMPDIGAGASPVAFGCTKFFVIRIVKSVTRVQRLIELYAEYGIVAFQSYMRVDGALLCASGGSPVASDSPVKFLSNAS
jgi:HK97 family phage major capsid protein